MSSNNMSIKMSVVMCAQKIASGIISRVSTKKILLTIRQTYTDLKRVVDYD